MVQSTDPDERFGEVETRLKRLEKKIFGDPPGGPTDIDQRLANIQKELADLTNTASAKFLDVDQKLIRTIRVNAQLAEVVEALRHERGQGGVAMETSN